MNLFIISLFIIIEYSINEIIINFKKNSLLNTNNNDEESLFKNIITNDMIINIQVGSQKQEIPISLKLQEYCTYLLSPNLTTTLPTFDSNSSSTFKKLSERPFLSAVEDYKRSFKVEDNFCLNNKEEINEFKFILAAELREGNSVRNGGALGLQIDSPFTVMLCNDTNIIQQLKDKKFINSFGFFFNFDKDLNKGGQLVLGAYPHESSLFKNNKLYREKNVKTKKIHQINYAFNWGLYFDKIKFGDNFDEHNKHCSLMPELNGLIAINKYKIYITEVLKEDINKKNCIENEIEMFQENYTYLICDKNVKFNNIKNLEFYVTEFDYTFKININDLIYEKDNKKYLLILFPEKDNNWVLGLPFYKNIGVVSYDLYRKTIGFYISNNMNNESGSGSNFILFFLAVILLSLIIYILFYLKKKIKKRNAQELFDTIDSQYEQFDINKNKLTTNN